MPRNTLVLPVFLLLAALAGPASAAYPFFGAKETVRIVAVTGIPAENGVNYNLGRKLTLKAFLLPYAVEDGGYVLVAADDPKKFFPMPAGPKLATLQANGFLPNPLPPVKLKLSDYLVGYLLWWLLFVVFVLPPLVRKLLAKKDEFGQDE